MVISNSQLKTIEREYKKGKFDRQIAEKVGLSITTINRLRREQNLPSNMSIYGTRGIKNKLNKYALTLYKKRLSDKKIAEILGTAENMVFNWRKQNNLPANHYCGDIGISYKEALPESEWPKAEWVERFIGCMKAEVRRNGKKVNGKEILKRLKKAYMMR